MGLSWFRLLQYSCLLYTSRISDHAVNIMESAQELYEKGLKFSENAKKDLEVLGQAVEDLSLIHI